VISKEAKKILKYEKLTLAVQRMWSIKQNWDHVNIPKILEQQTGKVQNQ
jgi:hypothetical protein